MSCSTSPLNTTALNNYQTNKVVNSNSLKSKDNLKFGVKFSSAFNAEAYRLTYKDIRDSIKNKTIPDTIYHYFYTQNSETERVANPTYLEVKGRLESGEFSEDAYLIANPDIKTAVDAGTLASGYQHWYSYAYTNEPTRKSKQEYLDAKSAIDAGFNEKAYRMVHTDIDNLVKSNALASAYIHYNTWAKTNEPTRVTSDRYVKIKNAILEGYNENAYLLAYPDVKTQVTSGFFPKGIDHYINYGVSETRLERDIYQDAKLAIVNDFDETRYRTAYPDVLDAINLYWFPSAFEHFRRYGLYEGRLTRQVYLDTKDPDIRINTYTTNLQGNPSIAMDNVGNFVVILISSLDSA